jgi:hypothetical protein
MIGAFEVIFRSYYVLVSIYILRYDVLKPPT